MMACRVPKRAMAVMSRMGMCIAYESVTRLVKRVSTCISQEYKELAQKETFVLVWDNLNQMYRVKKRILSKQEHLSNETQGFLIFPDHSLGVKDPLKEGNIQRKKAMDMIPEDIIPSLEYIKSTAFVHISNIIYRHFRSEMKLVMKRDEVSRPTITPVSPLPITRTRLYPLPTLKLNEGRIDETLNVIEAFEDEIGLYGADYAERGWTQMCGGDFVTCRNTQRAIYQRIESIRYGDSKGYMEPTIGMFHFTMQIQMMVMNNFFGRDDGKDKSSVAKYAILLGDNKIDKSCKEFRSTDFLLHDMLDAHVISLCITATGCSKMEEFSQWLQQEDHDWEGLFRTVVDQLFNPLHIQQIRYDDATGTMRRRAPPMPFGPADEENIGASGAIRDVALENAILFTRDMLVYRELQSSCKQGDPGRLIPTIKYFTILFQGTKQFNYARETIHLVACLERIWDDKALAVWKSTVLVNPTGKEGGFLEKDRYNEILVRDGKGFVRPWTNQLSDEYNKRDLIRQLQTMRLVKRSILQSSGAVDYKEHSQVVDSKETVGIIVRDLMKERIFLKSSAPRERCHGRDNSLLYEARDLFFEGMCKLATGEPISKYRRSARCNWSEDGSFFADGDPDPEDEDNNVW